MSKSTGASASQTGLSQAEPISVVSALTGFDPSRLAELAKRAEKQDGAEWAEIQELFEDAFRHCLPKPPRIWVTDNRGEWTEEYSVWQARQSGFYEHLQAMSFLDAAMSLAGGMGGEVTFFKDGTAKAFIWQPYPLAIEAKAATPALALCAAALKARAASAIEARSDATGTGAAEGESAASEAGDAR